MVGNENLDQSMQTNDLHTSSLGYPSDYSRRPSVPFAIVNDSDSIEVLVYEQTFDTTTSLPMLVKRQLFLGLITVLIISNLPLPLIRSKCLSTIPFAKIL
jgi:hypothetical protein